MTALLRIEKASGVQTRQDWRPHLIVLTALASAILLLFHRDAADMVQVWLESATFNHCALILPIIGWLVWQRLPELRQLVPSAWTPGLLIVGGGAATWLLGEAGGVALARHAGLVLMLQGSVIACLGRAVARGLVFPIAYAFFLIPVGEELVPPLQTLTAEMSMALLGLIGLPAHLDGIFITTPTGYFKVAEACAGVQFLIAMIAYGALVANLCFRSWRRRALFMLAAAAIPVLANGVRAWGTIYIAHLTTNEFAAGFDHVFYGWIFFALVIVLLMAAGWRFFDRSPGDPWFDPSRLQPARPRKSAAGPVALAAAAIAAAPLAWSAAIASEGAPLPRNFEMPAPEGWQRVPRPAGTTWQPRFRGADLYRIARYRNAEGKVVDLAIAVFARQEEGREMVGYGQGATPPESGWTWAANGPAPKGGRLDRIALNGKSRDVATFYRVGETLTGSDHQVKLETMKRRLFGGRQRAVAVLVSAEAADRDAIGAFLNALGPIDRLADGAAGIS